MTGRPNLSPTLASALVLAGALLLILVACHRAPAMEKPTPPPGEVWIAQGEATEADLATEPAAVREIGATRTSGRMAWDDLHVARVFSPVDGRVVAVSARVGQHVKKGAALATIDSPEVRRTLRDVIAAEGRFADAVKNLKRTKELQPDRVAALTILTSERKLALRAGVEEGEQVVRGGAALLAKGSSGA